uniref:Putative tnf receptor-associated factor 6 n=1 Tax=Rhipicephalus microplus TaxID=6941 RepID=A0A6M2D7L4_RHIMP
MPTASHRYMVVGFSDELDWSELTFVEPISPNKICKACGLVTRVTAFLPCLHVFCKKCYEQCRHDSGHCCPLDGQRALEEDVVWIHFPVENLLKRKVKCWNEDCGCDTVLAASELNKHFFKDCDHHSISCPGCSMVVECNNVCAHMKTECRGNMSVASKDPPTDATGERALMMALSAKLDTQVNEMKRSLEHFTHEKNAEINHLNETSNCANTLKETLLEISSRSGRFDSIASCSKATYETLNCHGEKLH